jgi:hypothetical protein
MNKHNNPQDWINKAAIRKFQGGWILGALLALVLAAAVTAVMFGHWTGSDGQARISKNTAHVTSIIAQARSSYSSMGFNGLTTQVAIGGNVIPAALQTSTTTAANEWSGAVTLVDNSATTAKTGLLTWASVPSADYVVMVQRTQSQARRIDVAGTAVKSLDGTLNMTTLNTQCMSSAQVSIAWTIGAI